VRNGLLLRADLHRLVVGERLRQDYRNGRSYYPLHGTPLATPGGAARPADEFLRWHQDAVFRG
jgi:putative restriction endonuclease